MTHTFPYECTVFVEIAEGQRIKYEFDEETGLLAVDRFLSTSMAYPAHYGFADETQAQDGDPSDVLVLCDEPLMPGCSICVRVIGILDMADEKGGDEKILAVPAQKISHKYDAIQDIKDIAPSVLQTIEHFFMHYKDLEKGKKVSLFGRGDKHEAYKKLIQARYAFLKMVSPPDQLTEYTRNEYDSHESPAQEIIRPLMKNIFGL